VPPPVPIKTSPDDQARQSSQLPCGCA
jgi:hypothetical protein